jgi:probable rRNA maturation factor
LPSLHPVAVRFLPGCRGRVAVAELRRVARALLSVEGVAAGTGVEVVLADSDTVQDLNRLYRGRNEPTDVLSFASHEGEAFIDSPEEAPSLGEVVVCLPIAEAQATAGAHPVAGEVAHLLVHGLLHILGYDHEEPDESDAMKTREDEILTALSYSGQYAHGH